MASNPTNCLSRRLRYIIDLIATDKSRYFAITESIIVWSFDHQVSFSTFKSHYNSLEKRFAIFRPRAVVWLRLRMSRILFAAKSTFQRILVPETELLLVRTKNHDLCEGPISWACLIAACQSDGKFVNRRLSLSVDLSKSRDFWCWPKEARPLGTGMIKQTIICRSRGGFSVSEKEEKLHRMILYQLIKDRSAARMRHG